VVTLVELLQSLACDVGIDCRRRDVGVAEQELNDAEALALYRVNALDAGVKGALESGL
jgi:hypothetical protein